MDSDNAKTETAEFVPIDISHTSSAPAPEPWQYIKKHGFERRPLKVAIVGAGAGGICIAVKLLQAQKSGALGPIEFTLYDKEDDYGGVWHVNRYPGCKCDIPSHVYQFSFAPYSDWPQFFSTAPAIKTYFHIVAQRFGVEPYIRLRHTIKSAIYQEETGKYDVTIQDPEGEVFTSTVDVYISATGSLSNVKWPDIPGLGTFTKNPIVHTAQWPRDFDWRTAFKDEKVAVIGIGASGLQLVGEIASSCKALNVFARSQFWVSPPFLSELTGERNWVSGNFDYSEEEKERFRKDPEALYKHGSELSAATLYVYDLLWKDSDMQKQLRKDMELHMTQALEGLGLAEKLIPSWSVWCRRLTPATAFLEAIHLPHVKVVHDGITSINENGIIDVNGSIHEVDRILLATGFDTSFRPRYELRGRNGVSLTDAWATAPQSYLSVATAGFPNLFFLAGPAMPYAQGSWLPALEANANYIIRALAKLQKQDIISMEPLKEAQDDFNEQRASQLKDLVFTDTCSSWYKPNGPDSSPDVLYSGSIPQYIELLDEPRWEDWKFTSQHRNRFSFLGKGTGTIEAAGGNRASYLKLEDHVNPLRLTELKEAIDAI